MIRFLWNSTRGYRLSPWRSPYLRWRIETYCGRKADQIGFLEFWGFCWQYRRNLWRFLHWTGQIERTSRYRSPAAAEQQVLETPTQTPSS